MPTLGGNNPDLRVRSVSKLAPTAGMSWSRYAVHNAQMALEAANSEAAVSEPFSRRRSSTPQPVGGYPKRCVDIVVALSVILLTLPLMGAITVLLCCSGGSPIFSHERVGFGGRKFRCLKFRTMVPDAGTLLAGLFAERPDLEEQWTTRRKLAGDPRITPLGRFLRQSSLDELPQLFNVLRGDMSCVGPRPVTEEELEHYGPRIEEYQSVRPGLTGLWQVSGRNEVCFADRVRLDMAYINDWSLRSDIVILARTPFALFNFKTAY
jgi:exopolysaccharide production protein ExoY